MDLRAIFALALGCAAACAGAHQGAGRSTVAAEEPIALDAVPPAARDAIVKRFGDAKVEVEKKTVVLYEAEVVVDGKEQEILVTSDGRTVTDWDDDDGDDDHDDHDEGDVEDDD